MNNIPDNVLVDDADRQMLEAMGKWYFKDGYCVRSSSRKLGKRIMVYMHRVIMNAPDDMQVDHVNGNRLDNRRCNLRIVTSQQNSWNHTKAKGYSWHSIHEKWMARIRLNYKDIFLGYFNTEEEAREAYLKAKEKYHKI